MESTKSATPTPTPTTTQSLLALLAVPFALLWAGYVISQLWLWFIVPLGVTPITMWQGAGIDVLVVFLMSHLPTRSEVREMTGGSTLGLSKTLLRAGLWPLMFLGVGWLLQVGQGWWG